MSPNINPDQTPRFPHAKQPQAATRQTPIGLEQRLVAEAVRLYEDSRGTAIDDPRADADARATGGDLEHRVIRRALALTIAQPLLQALHQLRNASGLIIAIGVVAAALAGAATARTAFGPSSDEPINFFWVFGSILGVPTLMLIVWAILFFLKPGAMASGSLGGAILALGRRVTRWLHKDALHIAMAGASGRVLASTAIGRWTLSALSHALWLAFTTGCLLMVILMLGTQQYTFIWETTILSERTYVPLTRALAFAPEAIGFTTPDAGQIKGSQLAAVGTPPSAAGEAWSGLLVGGILVYGLLPRMVLLLLCFGLARRAAGKFQLDMTLTGYMRLETRLQPVAEVIGVVDPDAGALQEPEHASDSAAQPEAEAEPGPIAIMGLEIDQPQPFWPPAIDGADWLDLGLVDTREQRRRVAELIQASIPPPRLIVVVCSLAAAPDRGIRTYLANLGQTAGNRIVLVLTEGQRLRARGHTEQMAQRIDDWRRLAAAARIEPGQIREIDLTHLTDTSRGKLASLIGIEADATPARHIETAFDLIMDHAVRWQNTPNANQQAELHRAIARTYSNDRPAGQQLLSESINSAKPLTDQLQAGADRVVNLLPLRLRQKPRWLAAGATAGALGCVAAATLAAPAAIASLPLWAGLGAALALVVQPSDQAPRTDAAQPGKYELTTAVSGAALFAVLLELQGRDEASISRIIDQVAGEDDARIDNPDAVRAWLDELRHRFDLALVREQFA